MIGVNRMHLIMKSEFENLQINDNHEYESDQSGNKKVLKIYGPDELLIAKRVIIKKSTRYFGCKDYKKYLA